MRRLLLPLTLAVLLLVAVAGGVFALRGDDPPIQRVALLAHTPSPSPSPALVPLASSAPAPTADGVARALGAAAGSPALGTQAAVRVIDPATGAPLLSVGTDALVVPASTSKVLTASAVLTGVDPTTVLTTRVVGGPDGLVLVGGGDPSLQTADLTDLAAQVARAGITTASQVAVDTSAFGGPVLGPGWKDSYVTGGDVAPVMALMTDEGRTADGEHAPRSQEPDLLAGRQFLAALRAAGVTVPDDVVRVTASGTAPVLAHHDSAPVPELVARMLTDSDNDIAEALARLLARTQRLPVTFAGAAQAVRDGVVALGVPAADAQVRDGSGLSPLSRVAPSAVTSLLVKATTDDRLRPIVAGLPVAGFDGTLTDRFRGSADRSAAGRVRAKTGTLTGVSALAGYVVDSDGRLLVFDATANGVAGTGTGTLEARAALDHVATVLAGCGCR